MNQDIKQPTSDKTKIKNKKIKKVAHYQKEDLIKCNNEVALKFISFFDNLIQTNPCFVYHQNQSHNSKEKTVEKKLKVINPLREELVFGLNSILRKIKNNKVIGVVLTHPLTVHIQETLNELCEAYNIPFLIVPGLNKLQKILNLSSVTCLAFTCQVLKPNSICNQVFNLFKSYASQISKKNTNFENLDHVKNEKSSNALNNSKKDVCFEFEFPPLNQLYTYKSDDTQMSTSNDDQSKSTNNANSLTTDQSFILLEDNSINTYFPDRPYFKNEIKLDLDVNQFSNNQNVEDKNFTQNLFKSNGQSSRNLAAKSNIYKYQEPKVIYLEASKKRKIASKRTKKN